MAILALKSMLFDVAPWDLLHAALALVVARNFQLFELVDNFFTLRLFKVKFLLNLLALTLHCLIGFESSFHNSNFK